MEFDGAFGTGREERHVLFANSHRRRSQILSLLLAYFFLVIVGFSAFLLVPAVQGILNKKEMILAAELEGMKRIPEIEKSLRSLEGQLAVLTSESVSSRLDKLELLTGSQAFNGVQVKNIAQLNQDLTSLKSYMLKDPRDIVELKEMQSNYSKLVNEQSNYATKEAVSIQITTLQWVIGIVGTLFGLLFTVLFGSWWFIGRRSEKAVPTRPVRNSRSGDDDLEDEVVE
ncbi:hypothetical protein [Pseudomonas putida]|uniref:hypothetical protein n=1 Tax=Pseudomonas putida TaxID=303 RepID=UPI0015FC475B|nr:hypothetical protein [Pseudomonas putida]